MSSIRIGIIGSCVTRDAFTFPSALNYTIVEYVARTSLISLCSSQVWPKFLEVAPTSELSKFENTMVARDLQKTGLECMLNAAPEVVIVDLIDERFSLRRLDDFIITESASFAKTPMSDYVRTWDKIPASGEERLRLWSSSLPVLIDAIEPERRHVIVHRAYWATHYLDLEGERRPFPRQEFHASMNAALVRMYDELEQEIPSADLIQLEPTLQTADEGNRWGLAPFHYVDAYYQSFLKELEHLIV